MYNYIFGFLYRYYDNTKKEDKSKVPFLSTILVISVLLGLNFLSLRDIYMFQIKGISVSLLDYRSSIVLTILIFLNYIYFNERYVEILKNYNRIKLKNIICLIYIITTIGLAIVTAYSVRNNLSWW